MKVLVIDDEPTIVETIELKLRREGYTVFSGGTAEDGLRLFKQIKPDLCILDVMLPNRSGFDLCRAIRKEHKTPIIFLTARGSEDDRMQGFDLGADDYVVKPFNLAELVARVKAILRRSQTESPDNVVEVAGLRIDPKTYEITLEGKQIHCAPKEFALLYFLCNNPNQVFSRDALLDRVWGADAFVNSRTIDVHIRWLREHVEKEANKPVHLVTVRGVGYKFVP